MDNNAIPKTISGITIGIYKSSFKTPRPKNRYFFKAIAETVPTTVETKVEITATKSVFPRASN